MSVEPTRAYAHQVVLPFTDLAAFAGLAVHGTGSVYVSGVDNSGHPSVFRLAYGSHTAVALPFEGLSNPGQLAVERDGHVYVINRGSGSYDWNGLDGTRVLKLAAGSDLPIELPFPNLEGPHGIAVDSTGTVYVTEEFGRVVTAGSRYPDSDLLWGLETAAGIAVDAVGTIYVVDYHNARVVTLTTESVRRRSRYDPKPPATSELPFAGLECPTGVAVDNHGRVYVSDEETKQILMMAPGSDTPVELPFHYLECPTGVGVDDSGSVYVVDSGASRVLKLPRRTAD